MCANSPLHVRTAMGAVRWQAPPAMASRPHSRASHTQHTRHTQAARGHCADNHSMPAPRLHSAPRFHHTAPHSTTQGRPHHRSSARRLLAAAAGACTPAIGSTLLAAALLKPGLAAAGGTCAPLAAPPVAAAAAQAVAAAGGACGLLTKRSMMLMSSRDTKCASSVLVDACVALWQGGAQL
jgi:hypothetical protein